MGGWAVTGLTVTGAYVANCTSATPPTVSSPNASTVQVVGACTLGPGLVLDFLHTITPAPAAVAAHGAPYVTVTTVSRLTLRPAPGLRAVGAPSINTDVSVTGWEDGALHAWLPASDATNGPAGASGYLSPWPVGVGAPPGTTWQYGYTSASSKHKGRVWALPYATFLPEGGPTGAAGPHALTLLLHPYDPAPVLLAEAGSVPANATAASLTFARQNLRVTSGTPASFTSFLIVHPPDVRSSLDVVTSLYPELFEADARAGTDKLWGAAQYADYRGQTSPSLVNSTMLAELGLSFNWDATFPFPFWGQWIGFNGAKAWEDCVAVGHMDVYSHVPAPGQGGVPPPGVPPLPGTGQCESVNTTLISSWYASASSALNVSTLLYANLMEWGYAVEGNRSVDLQCGAGNDTAYCTANALWRGHPVYGGVGFWSAGVGTGDYSGPQDWNGSTWTGTPGTWPIAPGVQTMDPGVEPYRSYILEQVGQQVVSTPSAGVCIDRSDHIRKFNPRGDDGVSWADGSPASWLGSGYASVVKEMGEMLHVAGMAVCASSTAPRLDLMGLMDVLYDEFGDLPWCAYVDGLLGLAKPVAAWYASPASLHGSPPVEAYLQTCILNGVSPSVPWVLGDHIIAGVEPGEPDPVPLYYAYAPLYTLLTHKRWLLTEGAVGLVGTSFGLNISTNAFLVGPAGSTVMVPILAGTDGLRTAVVDVRVNASPVLPGGVPAGMAALLTPGSGRGGAGVPLSPSVNADGSLLFSGVPLGPSGFVVLLLRYGTG